MRPLVAGPLALLLLPRTLDDFILQDHARDLLRSPGVVATGPGRIPYGAYGRLPAPLARRLAAVHASRLGAPGDLGVVVIYHPLQLHVAEGLLGSAPGAVLWYARWDRYERAYDASPALRRRLEALHAAAARRAELVFAVSGELVELERRAGRSAELVPPPHDAFPAPDPEGAVIAVSLGHWGRRTDWGLLRGVAERMPELVVLLVGGVHPGECEGDADFAACRALPNLVWLGRRPDEEAARLILCADVGILPFKREPFNDAGLPQRIVKHARLGRATIVPPLAGVRTWERAIVVADGVEEWVTALETRAGARTAPDLALRGWALAQTAEHQNAPLRERLAALGVAV